MFDASDMSTPVTRGELKEELAKLHTEISLEIDHAVAPLATKAELSAAIAEAVAPLATKVELEMWGGGLLAMLHEFRVEMAQQRTETAQLRTEMTQLRTEMTQLRTEMTQQFKELQADLARHVNAVLESIPSMIRPIDDKYKDLPGRVGALEAAVFEPRPR